MYVIYHKLKLSVALEKKEAYISAHYYELKKYKI